MGEIRGFVAMLRVMLVDDEEDALDRMPVDAVFLDHQMRGMTGMEAARAIKSRFPDLPIVFTTAHPEYAVEPFEVQSADYLPKPFTVTRLQASIRRIRQALAYPFFHDETRAGSSIQCLGGFFVRLPQEKRLLSWRTNKEKEVYAFLIHHEGRPADTALLIESIWPGHDLSKAKTYLYTCLSYLRRNLQEHDLPMKVYRNGSGFAMTLDGISLDAAEFENMLKKALSDDAPDERFYHKLNAVYRGEYLEGCDYRWAAARKEDLKTKYIRVLRKMHAIFRERGQVALAVDGLRRILALAPIRSRTAAN